MAKIGMVGMGKLGAPVALAIESQWHDVIAYDKNPAIQEAFETGVYPHKEDGVPELIRDSRIKFASSIGEVVANSEIIFLPIQTPHDPKYEGTTRIPADRKDFDYSALEVALADVANECGKLGVRRTVAVISTCLPGTYEEKLKPILDVGKNVDYVYNPLYIAMGSVVRDYLNPEYVLIGTEDSDSEQTKKLEAFYNTLHNAPHVVTDITTAEGIKVFYNTNITQKTILANAHMQTAHKMGMNIDDINRAMMMSTDRIVSTKYMRSGGPDSGGCHPRDLIALSWLGDKIDLKPNWFEMMAQTRELQTEWTADLVEEEHEKTGLPVYVMGKAFKPETNITTGSGATLLVNILRERGIDVVQYDPNVDSEEPTFNKGIYFVATEHPEFAQFKYPDGSTILDLWRFIPKSDKLRVIQIGNPNADKDMQ